MTKSAEEHWPESALEDVTQCPFCSGTRFAPVYENLADITFHAAPGRFSMSECEACGSGFLNPRPKPEFIGMAYARYYTHREDEPVYRHHRGLGLIRHMLANNYRNARYGARLSPSLPGGAWLIGALPRQRIVLDAYYRFLPRNAGRLLDFGCGNGGFLDITRSLGWDCTGVDLDEIAVATASAHGHTVHHGGQQLLDQWTDHFFAVTASHVLEHVHEPISLLKCLYRVLKPGGQLYVETPNFGSVCRRHFGPAWRGMEAPRHLCIATPKALTEALSACGFTQIRLHHRPDVFVPIYKRSLALSRNENSESAAALDLSGPSAELLRQAAAPGRSEYLSFTAARPLH
jgi:2-polyprenyl-3-methyl-5-hydroxy-6-metoxy-1,4-benzoquinol methylase